MTPAGVKRGRGLGAAGGPKLDAGKRAMAIDLYWKKRTVGETCWMVGIFRPTLYTYVKQADRAD
jgi:hypothetical protein